MIVLTSQQHQEIAAVPELAALAPNGVLAGQHVYEFLCLSAQHNRAESFLGVFPQAHFNTGAITLLARYNAVEIAKQWNAPCTERDWKNAMRRAAKSGHVEFADYVLSQCDTTDIRKAALSGACIGNQAVFLEHLLSSATDPGFCNHLPTVAAQHNATDCMRVLLPRMTHRVWCSALSVAVFQEDPTLAHMMLESVPSGGEVDPQWASKIALRALLGKYKDPEPLLRFLFQHITLDDILVHQGYLPPSVHETVRRVHQHIVLTAATHTTAPSPKPKKI